MSQEPKTFEVTVERIGRVELQGEGPWHVHEQTRSSFEICDSRRRPAKPKVWRFTGGANTVEKAHQNVVWAFKSVPNQIVAAANAKLKEVSGE